MHQMEITCCAYSPSAKVIITGSADNSIKIWSITGITKINFILCIYLLTFILTYHRWLIRDNKGTFISHYISYIESI